MPIGNGGIIGPANVPTITTASGVWSLREQQQAQGRGAWPLALAPDPYFEYTTLLLPGNGTDGANNNTFLDSSTNNFTITRNGNTTQGTFSPFSQTGWGNFLNGSTAYLTVAANSAINDFGTGDFNIELWFYATSSDFAVQPSLLSCGVSWSASVAYHVQIRAGGIVYFFGGDSIPISINSGATTVSVNTWNHVAVSRASGTTRLFVNGTQASSTNTVANISKSSTAVTIGALFNAAQKFTGYLSNVRIVKGQALYTGNFTPPTAALTTTSVGTTGTNVAVSLSGTVGLLTCQSNRFIDNSSNNSTITATGSPSVVAFSPFNPTASWSAATYGGSGYFDGSGDYLSVADNANLRFGTSAFTIQAWIYRNASGTAHSIIAKGGASTGYVLQVTSTNVLRFTHGTTNVDTTTTIPAYAWTHVAAVRTDTATNGFQLYINGVSSATATVSTNFNQTDSLYIGGDRSAANVMHGYISGLKYTNGTAESISVPTEPPTATTNVALLTNFTNAGIRDATAKNDLETVGNAQISNTTAQFGGTSIKFNGTTDYLAFPSTSDPRFDFGTGDFTVECWIYLNSIPSNTFRHILSFGTSGLSQRWLLRFDTRTAIESPYLIFYSLNSSNVITTIVKGGGSSGWSSGVWYYVAVTRSGNDFKLFRDGLQNGATVTDDSPVPGTASTGRMYIGAEVGGSALWDGYIQDVRITRGYARPITSKPTAAFPTL